MEEAKHPSHEPTHGNASSAIVVALLERVLLDRQKGGQRSVEDYVAAFPGHEDLVRTELARLASDGPPAAATSQDRIGRYRIVDTIGRGGQGIVYLALDERLGRRVALKLLTGFGSSSLAAKERFRREAEAASRLAHPGLCALHDADEHEGVPFLVMHFVEGKPLLQHLADVPADARRAATIDLFERVARALHHAHEAGFVHRDVKPGNILVTAAGDPIVIDFGLVRSLDDGGAGLTRSGELFGTPAYLAPEQIRAGSPLADRRVDVWALGVSLYEALTGRRPFGAPTYEALCRVITDEEPTDLRGVPNIGTDLAVVVATALAKEPASRYSTAAALADDLAHVRAGEPILARPVTTWMRVRRWARRNRGLATLAALAVIQLVAGAVVSALFVMRGIQGREWERLADLRAVEHMIAEVDTDAWPVTPRQRARYDAWLDRAANLERRLPEFEQRLANLRSEALPAEAADFGDPADMPALADMEADIAFAEMVGPLTSRVDERFEQLQDLPEDAPDAVRLDATARVEGAKVMLRWASTVRDTLGTRRSAATALRDRQTRQQRWRFPDEVRQFQHEQLERLIAQTRRILVEGTGAVADIRERRSRAIALEERVTGEDAEAWRRCIADVARGDSPYHGTALAPIPGLVPLGTDEHSGLWEFWHMASGRRPSWKGENLGRGHVELGADGAEGIVLVLVPGGSFHMGASRPEEGLPNPDPRAQAVEWPPHEVVLAPFLIAKFEVTLAQWRTHGDPNVTLNAPGTRTNEGIEITGRHPATQMSYLQAREFCRRLDLDLPTEAQWERAVRGGTSTPYPHGADSASLVGCANILDAARVRAHPELAFQQAPDLSHGSFDDGFAETAPVGSLRPNAYGLHDVCGNAAEWCRDRFFFYEQRTARPGDGQRGSLEANYERTARISAAQNSWIYCRSAMRSNVAPHSTWPFLGFRPSRSIDPERASMP